MTGWTCETCGARGDGDRYICPMCGPRHATEPMRWLCTDCGTEGRGPVPDECPGCGSRDAWYATNAANDDSRPMDEVWAEFCFIAFAPPAGRKH